MNTPLNTPELNERLWQKWIWTNKERDKAGARKRLRFLQIVLAMAFAAAVLQSVMK
jgi:hypothetical protein